jgi:hypothetical protein
MKDQYVGDISDFEKYAILRARRRSRPAPRRLLNADGAGQHREESHRRPTRARARGARGRRRYPVSMSLSTRELSHIERLNAAAARRERMMQRAIGLEAQRVLNTLRPYDVPQLFDTAKRVQELTRPRVDFPAIAAGNVASIAARNVITDVTAVTKTNPVLFRGPTAIDLIQNMNPALAAIEHMSKMTVPFAFATDAIGIGRTATLARYWSARDPFGDLTRRLDLLASQRHVAAYVTAMSARHSGLFASYVKSFAAFDASRDAFAAATAASSVLRTSRLLTGDVSGFADALRVHDLLRRQFADVGLELTWEELYGESLRDLVDELRRPADPVERERRLLLFGVFYSSVEAADAFAEGDVAMGVVHTMAAMYLLHWYWELRPSR